MCHVFMMTGCCRIEVDPATASHHKRMTYTNCYIYIYLIYLPYVCALYICKYLMQLAVTTLSFDNHLLEDGHYRSKYVGGLSYVYKLLNFLWLCSC